MTSLTNTLFYTNLSNQTLYEIGTDGSGDDAVLTLPPEVLELVGISFTPTGDLVLLSSGFLGLNTLYLYDSDKDADLIGSSHKCMHDLARSRSSTPWEEAADVLVAGTQP